MARSGVTGDFAKLERLIRTTRAIALGAFGHRAVGRMGDTGKELAVIGASQARNPQGRPWKPLQPHQAKVLGLQRAALGFAAAGLFSAAKVASKAASAAAGGGGGRALQWMAATLVLFKSKSGFTIRSVSKHAIYHQTGAHSRRIGPVRPGQRHQTGGWRLPVRRVVPLMRRALPKPWRKAFDREVGKVWVNLFRGKGR